MPGGMPFSQPSSVGDTRGDGVDVGSGAVESSRDGVDHKNLILQAVSLSVSL